MNLTRRNLIRTLTALPAAAFGIASMAPTLSSAASQRPQAAPPRYGAGLRLGALPYRDVSMPVAVHYPTLVPEQPVDLGPYRMSVAMRAPAAQGGPWPVVFVSHGTGGSVLGHADLAAGLARAGNVVVALEHPGDNYRDRSLVGDARYFSERPAQLLAVMRAVLDSEGAAGAAARLLMGDLSIDAKAIALLGHSAGGFTAAVVAGARGDRARVAEHCATHASADPMCALRDPSAHMSVRAQGPRFVLPADASLPATSSDPRVRALVLLAPLTVPLDPASLAGLPAATLIIGARRDEVLPAHFHLEPWTTMAPHAQRIEHPQAGHFSFMTSVPAERRAMLGPAGVDPDGFDRADFQRELTDRVGAFLGAAR